MRASLRKRPHVQVYKNAYRADRTVYRLLCLLCSLLRYRYLTQTLHDGREICLAAFYPSTDAVGGILIRGFVVK